jgi:hypothetical protein
VTPRAAGQAVHEIDQSVLETRRQQSDR